MVNQNLHSLLSKDLEIGYLNGSYVSRSLLSTVYCPLQVGCQEGLGNRWIHFVLWFTQLHGLYRT